MTIVGPSSVDFKLALSSNKSSSPSGGVGGTYLAVVLEEEVEVGGGRLAVRSVRLG